MEIKLEIESKTEGRNKLKGLLLSVPRAKNEKEVIAGWRTELSIILEIFNVGPASPVWQSLIVSC